MTLLALLIAISAVFATVLTQEWRELTRNKRYACKLDKAKHNRKVGG